MYHTKIERFSSEKELLNYLGKLHPIEKGLKTAIVGGHFILLYDTSEEKLKPMVWQDLSKPEHVEYAKMMAGDFPMRTFNYSLQLYQAYQKAGHDSGLVLLVNDHKFQHHNKAVNGKGGELRKGYYKKEGAIPLAYKHILKENNIDPEKVLISNNNPRRQKTNLLPKLTFFYSEQSLRNRFDDFTKKELLKDRMFDEGGNEGERNLIFHSQEQHSDICLTQNGNCECAGEVIEFILDLLKRDLKQVIFFVPDECSKAVNNGVEAALYIYEQQTTKPCNVLVVAGIGGMVFNFDKIDAIELIAHQCH